MTNVVRQIQAAEKQMENNTYVLKETNEINAEWQTQTDRAAEKPMEWIEEEQIY
jgi:hypothetical protein